MPKEFWTGGVDLGPPLKLEHDGKTHFMRRVTTYELGLASDQCTAYCGCDIENMSEHTPATQIRCVAFFTAFGLCDESQQPYFEVTNQLTPSKAFIESVEQIALRDPSLLTALCTLFVTGNAPHFDNELLERTKKNLSTMKPENGKSAKQVGTESVAANG